MEFLAFIAVTGALLLGAAVVCMLDSISDELRFIRKRLPKRK